MSARVELLLLVLVSHPRRRRSELCVPKSLIAILDLDPYVISEETIQSFGPIEVVVELVYETIRIRLTFSACTSSSSKMVR